MDAQSDDQKLLVYQIEYLKEQNTKLNEKQKDDLTKIYVELEGLKEVVEEFEKRQIEEIEAEIERTKAKQQEIARLK